MAGALIAIQNQEMTYLTGTSQREDIGAGGQKRVSSWGS